MAESDVKSDNKVTKQCKHHALAIALPVQGHINPMMQLVRRLASRGCFVTVVNLESNHRKLSLEQLSESKHIQYESIPDRVPVPIASLDVFSSTRNRQLFRDAFEAMENDVLELLQKGLSTNISFILGDIFINWIGRVADAFALPKVLFSTTCASSLLIDHWIPQLLESGDIPVDPENMDKPVSVKIPGMPWPLCAADLPAYFDSNKTQDVGFQRRYAKAKAFQDYDWILVNSSELLEFDAFETLRSEVNRNIVGVGPLLEMTAGSKSVDAAWTADRECLKWLDKKTPSSVLYISFGSLATMPAEQFVEVAEGLKQSQVSFLWVVRVNMLGSESNNRTRALEEAAQALLKELQEEGKACIVGWAPQLEVLAHPSVGGFLTHCGWNSMLETLWYGVPILGWPQMVEQSLVCRMACGDWKVGLCLSGGDVLGRDQISQCIKELMTNEEFKRNCCALQDSLRSTNVGNESLDTFLQCL